MHKAVDRVYGLDLLRGLCSLLVVFYHLLIWTGHREMYSWGLHGVYIFFALSGASLTLAYKPRFDSGFPLVSFLMLRAARLGPLFALASIIMFAHKWLTDGRIFQAISAGILSTSLLFGFGNPGTTSLVLGGWSIGVEVVFYLIFPAVLVFAYSRRSYWVLAIVFLVQQAFVELTLSGTSDVKAVWQSYIQPLAFMAYFFCGCLIGRYVMSGKSVGLGISRIALLCVMSILVCLSGPSSAATVTGLRGVELFALSVSASFFAAYIEPRSAVFIKICEVAGNMSYGLYLLHPIVFLVIKRVAPGLALPYVCLGTLIPAILIALTLEKYFERPVRGMFRRYIFTPTPA
jgi:exopolysaccharide production protein ExoZ